MSDSQVKRDSMAANKYRLMLRSQLQLLPASLPPCNQVMLDSLQPLSHRRNDAFLGLFFRYFQGNCSSDPACLPSFPTLTAQDSLFLPSSCRVN
ncbi:hypothetical protein E2C01_068576 [Portunus trituberculatus]|uniref:Uncharacterized protein n=1 Tax=Portunus trituberculatus TaxID=210409 RepID=A0A5B7HW96_PORTR|nr:hypothetical protein [Portunus trituberculatus]